MRFLRTVSRVVATAFGAVSAALVAAYAVLEAHVWWYMRERGVVLRSDLSEDYGLGLDSFLLGLATIAVVLPLASWALWRLARLLPWFAVANPSLQQTASGGR